MNDTIGLSMLSTIGARFVMQALLMVLWLYGRKEPELSRTVINRAIDKISIPMGHYAPDGAYPEGIGYWDYGTSFNAMFLSAIEKAFGTDYGFK